GRRFDADGAVADVVLRNGILIGGDLDPVPRQPRTLEHIAERERRAARFKRVSPARDLDLVPKKDDLSVGCAIGADGCSELERLPPVHDARYVERLDSNVCPAPAHE